jgi:hypothetical protein
MQMTGAGKCSRRWTSPFHPSATSSRVLRPKRVAFEMVNTQRALSTRDTMDRSRQSIAPQQRNLSLTEELEKLEQSITLTLQGKQAQKYPASATNSNRNRPQLQPGASNCHQ